MALEEFSINLLLIWDWLKLVLLNRSYQFWIMLLNPRNFWVRLIYKWKFFFSQNFTIKSTIYFVIEVVFHGLQRHIWIPFHHHAWLSSNSNRVLESDDTHTWIECSGGNFVKLTNPLLRTVFGYKMRKVYSIIWYKYQRLIFMHYYFFRVNINRFLIFWWHIPFHQIQTYKSCWTNRH